IITIDVLGPARRAGIGSQLLHAVEERLRASGCHSVILETAVDNTEALSFYKRHRYNVTKALPRYYANGMDAFVMKKDLLSPA
ncbi:MAG: GNAT family N-acetyltransferase, partial [Terriglobales bacterium]